MLKHAFTIHLFLHRYTLCNNLFFPSFHTGSYSGIKMFWQPHANKIKYVGVYMGYKAVVIYTSLCHICSLKGSCILNIGGPPIWMWGSITMQTRDYHFVDLSVFPPCKRSFWMFGMRSWAAGIRWLVAWPSCHSIPGSPHPKPHFPLGCFHQDQVPL